MQKNKIVINACLVLPDKLLSNAYLHIEGEKIAGYGLMSNLPQELRQNAESYDAAGAYVIPGFIDIHSDMIENLIQPRSTAFLDMDMALDEAEKQLAQCGITTIFHSVAMYREGSWDAKAIRTAPHVERLIGLVNAKRSRRRLIHNRFHLRYELDNLECYDLVRQLLTEKKVGLVSLMDHRPGQGQYRDLKIYRRHLPGEGKDLTDKEFADLVKREQNKPMVAGAKLQVLLDTAKQNNIPIASHDDDTEEKILTNAEAGVAISEFPISLEVAKKAKECGLHPLLGAPNILLGGSHSGNLSAEVAIKAGCGDILCSDYYPQALLRAVFYLYDKNILTLPEACALVSSNPAAAAGISGETGTLAAGKIADFLVVARDADNVPLLLSTWANGCCVVKNTYRDEEEA